MTDHGTFDIIFLRHGESVGNSESRWQGQADYPLTSKGREQVQALSNKWLAEERGFDQILSSPLKRAKETAEIISKSLGISVETDPVWMERDIGKAAGMTTEEVSQHFPNRNISSPFTPFIGEESESNWELYLRAGQALQKLLRKKPGDYLVVSHGGLLNQVMYAIVGITPQIHSSDPRFHLNNSGFANIIYYKYSHQWQIKTFNDHSHWD